MDKKRKTYQHDSEAMEVVLGFLDRKQGAMHREYWGECSSATPPQAEGVREGKKENKLITSYECQAITVSFKHTKKNDVCGYFDCRSLDVDVFVAFKAPYSAERLG